MSTGLAYTAVPGNSASMMPQSFINTLADVMQYCTNSDYAR